MVDEIRRYGNGMRGASAADGPAPVQPTHHLQPAQHVGQQPQINLQWLFQSVSLPPTQTTLMQTQLVQVSLHFLQHPLAWIVACVQAHKSIK